MISPFPPDQTQQYHQFWLHLKNIKRVQEPKGHLSMMKCEWWKNNIPLVTLACCIMFWKFPIVWPLVIIIYFFLVIYLINFFATTLLVQFLQHFRIDIWNYLTTQKKRVEQRSRLHKMMWYMCPKPNQMQHPLFHHKKSHQMSIQMAMECTC